jgi:hypothetical protein
MSKQVVQQGYTYGSIHGNVYPLPQILTVLLSAHDLCTHDHKNPGETKNPVRNPPI